MNKFYLGSFLVIPNWSLLVHINISLGILGLTTQLIGLIIMLKNIGGVHEKSRNKCI